MVINRRVNQPIRLHKIKCSPVQKQNQPYQHSYAILCVLIHKKGHESYSIWSKDKPSCVTSSSWCTPFSLALIYIYSFLSLEYYFTCMVLAFITKTKSPIKNNCSYLENLHTIRKVQIISDPFLNSPESF